MKNNTDYSSVFKKHNCCVIIPTYNNSGTIAKVISDVEQYCDDIIVVNDGCTDDTISKIGDNKSITIIGYSKNRGKGFALRTGFKYAVEKGYAYAITIDSDGQHYASDLPVFLESLEREPNALLIGSRRMNQENVPGKSNFGNNFSNFWFKLETGISLPDTQSGYRLYPIERLKDMRFFTSKFEFEIEVIVRAAWSGVNVMCVPVDVFYPVREERVSHFRPFKDFGRISVLNTVLVTLALLYFRPRDIIKKYRSKSLKQIISEDVLGKEISTGQIALAIGFGVFMGIFPIWGYQLIVGFLIAHLLKINKTIFFLAANISIPPMIPLILYLSFVCGSYVMGHGSWTVDFELNFETIKNNFLQYFIGASVLAAASGVIIGSASYIIIAFIKKFKR